MVLNYVIFPTELAAESNTWNSRTPKKPIRYSVPEINRSPVFANHVGGKEHLVLNYVYISYGISC